MKKHQLSTFLLLTEIKDTTVLENKKENTAFQGWTGLISREEKIMLSNT